jgi:hypothetical protein
LSRKSLVNTRRQRVRQARNCQVLGLSYSYRAPRVRVDLIIERGLMFHSSGRGHGRRNNVKFGSSGRVDNRSIGSRFSKSIKNEASWIGPLRLPLKLRATTAPALAQTDCAN